METANCHYCKNKKFDREEGIICGLTNKKEYITNGCADYIYDGTYVPPTQTDNGNENEAQSSGANKEIIMGALFFIGGIVVTIASSGNGGGIIAYGAIIGGLIEMIVGFSKLNK